MMYGSWDMEWQKQNFLSLLAIFCPFTPPPPLHPLTIQKTKILKKWKKAWIYYHFTQLYHKWQSSNVRFLRAQQTEFFVTLHNFLPFYPTNNPKNQKFLKMKKHLAISSFYTIAPKIQICYTVPEIWCMTDVIFIFHFGLFFALLPP